MRNSNLNIIDTFTVVNRTMLNDNDTFILIMLYQPIIGSTSINLYLTLWSYLDKMDILSDTFNHQVLINHMGLSLTEFKEAREKIEGLGLLKTYLKKDEINHYIYELYSPLSAYDFLSNPLISTVLYTTLGSKEFKRLTECFKIPNVNLKDHEDITKKFSDIFISKNMIEANMDNIKKRNYNRINIESTLDIDNIINMIDDISLNKSRITDTIKDLIIKLAYIYDFDEEKTINVIKNSIDDKHLIDKDLLKINFQNYYQFENSGKLPSIVYKTQPLALRKEVTEVSGKAKIIYQFENVSPYKFLCMKNKTEKPAPSELAIIVYLLDDLGLLPGVVNVLIDYVLRINNNKLTKNFIEAIGAQWKRSNVKTVEDAMKIASDEYKNKKEVKVVTNSKYKKIEEKPVWFDKNIEEKEDSEKTKKIEEMLSKL